MVKIGKQEYADNFRKRARQRKKQVGWRCEKCHRKRGEVIQPTLMAVKKSKKIVVIAHHPNYDTENPDAELIILCRACHGKAQTLHNAEVNKAKQKEAVRDGVQKQKLEGQLELPLDDIEYPVLQVDFPISQFLQTVGSEATA